MRELAIAFLGRAQSHGRSRYLAPPSIAKRHLLRSEPLLRWFVVLGVRNGTLVMRDIVHNFPEVSSLESSATKSSPLLSFYSISSNTSKSQLTMSYSNDNKLGSVLL